MLDTTDTISPLDEIAPSGNPSALREQRFAEIGAAIAGLPVELRAARSMDFLPALIAIKGLLRAEERALPETGYGRCNIFFCPRELFTAVAVVWPAGITSPIHDHLTWCALGVIDGTIEEVRYAAVDGTDPAQAVVQESLRHEAGAVTFLPGAGSDIHSIHNPTAKPTVTLHIYGGDARKTGPNVSTVYNRAT